MEKSGTKVTINPFVTL